MLAICLIQMALGQVPPGYETKPVPFMPLFVGRVMTEDGTPIPGVSVFTSPYNMREGQPTYCPYATNDAGGGSGNHCHWCQPDRGSKAVTTDEGRFTVRKLDPDRDLQVVFSKEGYETKYLGQVDMTRGPKGIVLRPKEPNRLLPGHTFQGRIVNPKGRPVADASVLVLGAERPEGLRWDTNGIDKMTSTDEDGAFLITSHAKMPSIFVRIKADGLATRVLQVSSESGMIQEFELSYGAIVRGRVMRNENEVVQFGPVGIVQVNRDPAVFVGEYETLTDDKGWFVIDGVAPNFEYNVYGKMDQFAKIGSLPVQKIFVGNEGTLTNVGEMYVQPAYRIAGRVELSDGNSVPVLSRLLIFRVNAWDLQVVELSNAGWFEATGLPSETYGLAVLVPGYRLSPENKSMDPIDSWRLIGRVDKDTTGLRVLLEPGSTLLADREFHKKTPRKEWPRNLPLRGAPPKSESSNKP